MAVKSILPITRHVSPSLPSPTTTITVTNTNLPKNAAPFRVPTFRAFPPCSTRVLTRFTVTRRNELSGFWEMGRGCTGTPASSGGLGFPETDSGNCHIPASSGGGFAGSDGGGGGSGFWEMGRGCTGTAASFGGGFDGTGGFGSGDGTGGGGGSGFREMGHGYNCNPVTSGGGFDGSGGFGGGEGSGGGGGGGGCGGDSSTWTKLLWYMGLLESYPDLTRSVTSASLMLVGDRICQLAVDEGSLLDYRGIMFALSGLVLFGPALHFWCRKLLAKFLVLTKAVTSALLKLVGDFMCQVAIHKVLSLDYKWTLMLTLLGLVLVGPTLHFWYLHLGKSVTLPGASGAFLCRILDKILLAPAFIRVSLSASATLVRRLSEVVLKLPQEWFSSVLANWQLWRLFQFLDFRFVPRKFQVLASNFAALAWKVPCSFKLTKRCYINSCH